jgi:RNA polymerase sigma factor (sigma-70 family)
MIRSGPRLTTDEIVRRISEWKAGVNSSVLDPIVFSMSALIEATANDFHRRSLVQTEDLAAEGMVGLALAMRSFDDTKGTSFPTWAMYQIMSRMRRFIWRESFRCHVSHTCSRIRYADLIQLDESSEGIDLLSSMTGHKKETLIAYLRVLRGKRPSYRVQVDEEHTTDCSEFFIAEGDPEQEYSAAESAARNHDLVHASVAQMSLRDRQVANRRLLCDEDDQDTLEQIGDGWGISRERIRQLEGRVKDSLREHLAIQGYRRED